MPFPPLLAALGLAAVHVFAGQLERLPEPMRKLWLSLSGGFSVAFVMLYLLPELAARQEALKQAANHSTFGWLEHHVYVLSLLGMMVFYGLERIAQQFANRTSAPAAKEQISSGNHQAPAAIFWAHVSSFAAYNFTLGYLTHLEAETGSLGLFFLAIALHFVVLDFSLRDHYPGVYHDRGRWLLAVAVVLGWALSRVIQVPEPMLSIALAFLAGGIILNTLKEELPEEKHSRFWPFLAGAGLYTLVVLMHAKLAG